MTKKEKLIAKYIELMKVQVDNSDIEDAHERADELLCELLRELGFQKVVDEYTKVGKWYA